MIWYLILALIIIAPFVIYFVGKALQKHFNNSKDYYDAELITKTIKYKSEIEKDIIFNEKISEKQDVEYCLEFLLSDSTHMAFTVLKEDFDSITTNSKGKLCYKKILGIPTFISFEIKHQ